MNLRRILITLLLTSIGLKGQQPGITAETWTGLTPSRSILTLRDEGISTRPPNTTQTLAQAKITNLPANSGTRLRGKLTPTVDDNYTFWVNGTDNVALWISEDGTPYTKRLIAKHLGSTTQTEWSKHPDQKSVPIPLMAGVTYHIEAHVMTIVPKGHLSIGWQGSSVSNLALAANGATATQSSVLWGYDASKAIDGNINGQWREGIFTANQQNSWLRVNFPTTRPLNQIVLRNNVNDQIRLSNFRLSALDSNGSILSQQDFFTTSGNAGSTFTWNLPATVQAASIRIQLLGNNRQGNGHLALAEIEAYGPGPYETTRNFQIIPSAFLTTSGNNPSDTDHNQLADHWEQQTGLSLSTLPGARLEHGDPDKDGITNYEEQLMGSNPLAPELMTGGLIRSSWVEDSISTTVDSFVRNRSRFLSYPNETTFISNIDTSNIYQRTGYRYRGYITAPVSGTYRFWLSGSSDTRLWLADGSVKHPDTGLALTNRFGKQLIATSGEATRGRNFDLSPNQRSKAIELIGGQTYYLEVLQKINGGGSHSISVAWQTPGQPRIVIPPTAYTANAPDPLDLEDDNLPDSWETIRNLNPANNGRTSESDGEYGDPDNDGLTNLEEYQNNSNPFSADSDGDTISDLNEVRLYKTNPALSNNIAPVPITLPPLTQYTAATGSWINNPDGSITATDYRGNITHTFHVTQAGVHEVFLNASVISPTPSLTSNFPVELSLNGTTLGQRTMTSLNGSLDTFRALTPWLPIGTHTVTVHHHNFLASLRLRIDSLTITRLGGLDINTDGVPDWIAEKQTPANTLTRISATSLTSPVSIEGITTNLPTAQASAGTSPSTMQPIPLTQSINNTFYADIPLSETTATTLEASFLSGILTESHSITWLPTNLLQYNSQTLHIRQGDSLRLTAHDPAETPSGTFTWGIGGSPVTTQPQPSTSPITHPFNQPGTHTLTATWTPVGGPAQTATVTLVVHTADFGPNHIVRVGDSSNWTIAGIGNSTLLEADENLVFTEISTNLPRTFRVRTSEPINRHVIARLPATIIGAPSAILSRGTVHSYATGEIGQTRDAIVVMRYPDGTWLMRSTLVGVNLPPDLTLRLTSLSQGMLFTNGSTNLNLNSSHFNSNGIADIYYESTGVASPKICHSIDYLLTP